VAAGASGPPTVHSVGLELEKPETDPLNTENDILCKERINVRIPWKSLGLIVENPLQQS